MENARITALASLTVLIIGGLWGFYWVPVRAIAALGLDGIWGSVAIAGAGTLTLAPFAWRHRHALLQADPLALAATALGGLAFVLYSVSFLYGTVAVVIVMFFLSPVWSTLLGRLVMGWPITGRRVAVLVLGLGGLMVMLGGAGSWPWPRDLGSWLGLASGALWALASFGLRVRPRLPAVPGGFIFALGAFFGGLVLVPWLGGGMPALAGLPAPGMLSLWVGLTGGVWWALFIVALMWAAPRLDPARVGVLLMAEVLVAAASAAVLAGEYLSPAELIGGALVLAAGLVELRPQPHLRRASADADHL